jgi:hypothetical protein
MLEKNKGAKKKTNKVEGIRDIIKTGARKAAIKQAVARAKELYEPGYNTVYYLRSVYKV